ncbi:hypothetical protein [Vibrio spartinae]|uniref:hypothetical protein n=1 Tax=Vibrio spartinae TaxID=1918945 RepID=UPI0011153886|nr:hypothetical protein [Vibrio spartinae]
MLIFIYNITVEGWLLYSLVGFGCLGGSMVFMGLFKQENGLFIDAFDSGYQIERRERHFSVV